MKDGMSENESDPLIEQMAELLKYYDYSETRECEVILYPFLAKKFGFRNVLGCDVSTSHSGESQTAIVYIDRELGSQAQEVADWLGGSGCFGRVLVQIRGAGRWPQNPTGETDVKPQTGAPRERLGEHQSGEVRGSED